MLSKDAEDSIIEKKVIFSMNKSIAIHKMLRTSQTQGARRKNSTIKIHYASWS